MLFLLLSDTRIYLFSKSLIDTKLIKAFPLSSGIFEELNKVLEDQSSNVCVLLLDLSDEEFHLEYLPDLPDSQLPTIIKNRCRSYLDSPEKYCVFIEEAYRQQTLKRVMYCRFSGNNMLDELLLIINHQGIGLIGIFSICPIAIQSDAVRSASTGLPVLCVTTHDAKQWRLSLFENGFLLMSRSVLQTIGSTEAFVLTEVRATINYAISKKILKDEKTLEVIMERKVSTNPKFCEMLKKKLNVVKVHFVTSSYSLYERSIDVFEPLNHKKYNYASREDLKNIRKIELSDRLLKVCLGLAVMSAIYAVFVLQMLKVDLDVLEQVRRSNQRVQLASKKLKITINEYPLSVNKMQISLSAFEEIKSDLGVRKSIQKLAVILSEFPRLELLSISWFRDSRIVDPKNNHDVNERTDVLQNTKAYLAAEFQYQTKEGDDKLKNEFLQKLEDESVEILPDDASAKPLENGSIGSFESMPLMTRKNFSIRILSGRVL